MKSFEENLLHKYKNWEKLDKVLDAIELPEDLYRELEEQCFSMGHKHNIDVDISMYISALVDHLFKFEKERRKRKK